MHFLCVKVPPNSEMVEAATGPYSGDIAGDGSYGISPVVVGDAGSFGTGVFSVRRFLVVVEADVEVAVVDGLQY